MYHVRVTFRLRSRGVSVTYLYSYGISLSYVRRIKVYVLHTYAVDTKRESRIRHTYVADTKGTLYIRHGYVAC